MAIEDARVEARPKGRWTGLRPEGGVLEARLATPERAAELDLEAATLVAVELDAWAQSDLELLAGGALSPLRGYMGAADLESVREHMRLASGQVWPLPVLLPVEQVVFDSVRPGDRIALTAKGGTLAVLGVEDVF